MTMAKRKSRIKRTQEAGIKISEIFQKTEIKILLAFAAVVRAGSSIGYRNMMLNNTRTELMIRSMLIVYEARREVQNAVQQLLREQYEQTLAEISERIETASTASQSIARNQVEADMQWIRENFGSPEQIAEETTREMLDSLNHIWRDTDDVYRQIVEAATDSAQQTGGTVYDSVTQILSEFAQRGVRGFTDRAGRKWELQAYADMAMRTAMQKASMLSTFDAMIQHGIDVCYVNAHMGACPLCYKWQGVLMSLTGATPGLPTVREAMDDGLFHPNCAHIPQEYIVGVSRLDIGSPRGYTLGQSERLYKRRQKQRYIERQIRRWKRALAVAQDEDQQAEANAQIRRWQAEARQNTEWREVQRRYDREQVRS